MSKRRKQLGGGAGDPVSTPAADSVTVTLAANPSSSRVSRELVEELGPIGLLLVETFKHVEAMAALVVRSNNDLHEGTGVMARQLARQGELVEKYQDGHLKILAAMEDLVTQRHVRELASQSSATKMKMLEELFEKVNILAPHMINKWVGKPVMPTVSTPEKEMLRSFLDSLTPDEFHGIVNSLPGHKAAAVVALVRHFQEEAELAKQQKAKVTPINSSASPTKKE